VADHPARRRHRLRQPGPDAAGDRVAGRPVAEDPTAVDPQSSSPAAVEVDEPADPRRRCRTGGRVRRTGAGGRPVLYARRDIVDAIRYLDHNGVVWRALPVDFPPWRTVYCYFRKWDRDGTLNQLHNGLWEPVRLAEGRGSQTVPERDALGSQQRARRSSKRRLSWLFHRLSHLNHYSRRHWTVEIDSST
jgi:putative transposase